jgi:uncharacterized protein
MEKSLFGFQGNALWLAAAAAVWGLLLCILVGAEGEVLGRIWRVVLVVVVAAAVILTLKYVPRLGAVLTIIMGAIALTLAVVFGLYQLIKTGFSWQVVVGILFLAAGLILIVCGSRQLMSGIGRGWFFLTVPAEVIVVLLIIWITLEPVLATNIPVIPPGKETPADYGLTVQEVSFKASDGVDLAGWYIPSNNKAAVVLRHGSGSTGSDVLAQAAVLAKHGYGVLVTDARGHGKSSGKAMDFGWYGDEDIIGAIDYLESRPEIDINKIAVMGLSMGGEEAIGAAYPYSRISAVVAEGVTGRTDADKAWLKDVYGFRGQIQMGIEWLEYSITDLLTPAGKPVALSEAAAVFSPKPILLITAGEVEDEGYAAAFIKEKSGENVTIWTVPGARHTGGLATAPAEWESKVTGFLDKALGL